MSAINDLRHKILRLNGEKFTIAKVNTLGTSTCYSNIYRLVQLEELKEVGFVKESTIRKKSILYEATDKLKASGALGEKFTKKDPVAGWRTVWPEYFTKPNYPEKGRTAKVIGY